MLAPLGDYGGPTQTMALLPGSPAIDAGNSDLVPAGITTDQRGDARVCQRHGRHRRYQLQVVIARRLRGRHHRRLLRSQRRHDQPSARRSPAPTPCRATTITFDNTTVFATPQTITLTGTQLELSDTSGTETITGPAAGVTVSGGGLSRVFQVDRGVTASISGLTITGGHRHGDGGGLYNSAARSR